jgi:hypothetical protein
MVAVLVGPIERHASYFCGVTVFSSTGYLRIAMLSCTQVTFPHTSVFPLVTFLS